MASAELAPEAPSSDFGGSRAGAALLVGSQGNRAEERIPSLSLLLTLVLIHPVTPEGHLKSLGWFCPDHNLVLGLMENYEHYWALKHPWNVEAPGHWLQKFLWSGHLQHFMETIA